MSDIITQLIDKIGPDNFSMAIDDLQQMIATCENFENVCPCERHAGKNGGIFVQYMANKLAGNNPYGVKGWIVSIEYPISSTKLYSIRVWDTQDECREYANIITTIWQDFLKSLGADIQEICDN